MVDDSREKEGRQNADGETWSAEGARRAHRSLPSDSQRDPTPCDVCGVPALIWRKCKLVCENCGAINRTCADL